jgi:enterochelin esterase-like enzyme
VGRIRRSLDLIVSGLRRNAGVLVTLAVAALILSGAVALGAVDGSNAALIALGFDPDRAQLITALIVGGTAAVVAYLCGGVRWSAVLDSWAVIAALFGPTFVRETQNALAATGAAGAFDLLGWAQTLLSFLVIGFLTAWACATCAVPVRRELAAAARGAIDAARKRRMDPESGTRLVAALLVVGLLAITVPVAGDLFNYGADDRMIGGGSPRQGLVPNDQAPPNDPGLPVDAPTATASPSARASVLTATAPSSTPAPSPTAFRPPWAVSPPTGLGRMEYRAYPAPWVRAGTETLEVAVYLPPGYDTSGSRRYPTVYQAPFLFNVWNAAFHVKAMLDALIDEGQIPPSLFIFMNGRGGAVVDPQCSDTYDRSELFDRYLGVTVPADIDKHYRTIATPSARAIMGMSEGGYCAAILSLHHPGVFGSQISFSGYYTAGATGGSAKAPFGNNATSINNGSPNYVAPRLDPMVKLSLYAVIVAQSSQVFYGGQATAYVKVLDDAGIKNTFIEAGEPHGWTQVREHLAEALTLVGVRQAELGVFD